MPIGLCNFGLPAWTIVTSETIKSRRRISIDSPKNQSISKTGQSYDANVTLKIIGFFKILKIQN